MHGLQACLFKYITVAAFHIYAQRVKMSLKGEVWERSGSVVKCLTRDRRAAGSSLTGVTALLSLSKAHLS